MWQQFDKGAWRYRSRDRRGGIGDGRGRPGRLRRGGIGDGRGPRGRLRRGRVGHMVEVAVDVTVDVIVEVTLKRAM